MFLGALLFCGSTSVDDFLLVWLQVPARGDIYSINEGNAMHWGAAVTQCAL